MNRDRELLLRSLGDELTSAESEALESRLDGNRELRAERDRLVRLHGMLTERSDDSFADGFPDRVMRGIWKARETSRAGSGSLYSSLRWVFVRVAPACLLIAVGLGVYSGLIAEGGLSSSVIESVLGLPAESLDSALFLASM